MVPSGLQPAEVKLGVLPTETDNGYEFFVMKNLNDGLPAITSIVGAVCIDEGILTTWQIGVGGEDDGSDLAFGAEKLPGGYEG